MLPDMALKLATKADWYAKHAPSCAIFEHQLNIDRCDCGHVKPGARTAVLVRMLIVCAFMLDDPEASDSGIATTVLSQRLTGLEGGRAAFAGDDDFKTFRELAWEVSVRLCAAVGNEPVRRWARVLREVLHAVPESAGLAN